MGHKNDVAFSTAATLEATENETCGAFFSVLTFKATETENDGAFLSTAHENNETFFSAVALKATTLRNNRKTWSYRLNVHLDKLSAQVRSPRIALWVNYPLQYCVYQST